MVFEGSVVAPPTILTPSSCDRSGRQERTSRSRGADTQGCQSAGHSPRCRYVRAVLADLTCRPGSGSPGASYSLDACSRYSSSMAAGISTLDLSTTGRRFMPSAASRCLSARPASLNAALLAPEGLGVSPHTMPVITATINSTPLIIVDQTPVDGIRARLRTVGRTRVVRREWITYIHILTLTYICICV